MQKSAPKTSFKPLIILIGISFLILELGSYITYNKHLGTLIAEVAKFDYSNKNWQFTLTGAQKQNLNDTLKIDMSEFEFQAMSHEWNEQYKNKHRITGFPWVGKKKKYSARIKHLNGSNSKWQKSEISMMGMLPDHHGNFERMSLKVNLKGNNRLFSKKAFSLVLPETRSYFVDQLINQVFKEKYQGIQIQTQPVWVQFRKNQPLVMLLEDKFDKYLIESNQRRESIIFEKGFTGNLRDIPGIQELNIDLSCNATLGDTNRNKQLIEFSSLQFNDTQQGPFEHIDLKKTLGVWALGMVCGSWHHWVDINMHWYYNPVNHKFEPTIREVNIDPNWLLNGDLNRFENRKKAYKNYLQKLQNEIVQGRPNFLISFAKWGELHIPEFWQKIDREVINAAKGIESRITEYQNPKWQLSSAQFNQYHDIYKTLTEQSQKLAKNHPENPNIRGESNVITYSGHNEFTNLLSHDAYTSVKVLPGTRIVFKGPNALWKLNGAVHFEGTEDQPIVVEADSECAASLFIESSKEVVLKHVIFKYLSNLSYGYWKTPASITIHKTSNVIINNCVFIENRRGDDYLNLFGCDNFTIKNCVFKNVKSDAFDSDFSNGIVENTRFEQIGNDGIDGSGSQIHIANCYFKEIKDKAVSSGEKSNFTLVNAWVSNSEIGLVSKDLSKLKVRNTQFNGVRLTAAIFQKKPEYGTAQLEIDSDLNNGFYLIEKGSDVHHTGDTLVVSENVKDLLYGNEYGSATQK